MMLYNIILTTQGIISFSADKAFWETNIRLVVVWNRDLLKEIW